MNKTKAGEFRRNGIEFENRKGRRLLDLNIDSQGPNIKRKYAAPMELKHYSSRTFYRHSAPKELKI